jgi:hypothetical protein
LFICQINEPLRIICFPFFIHLIEDNGSNMGRLAFQSSKVSNRYIFY